MEPTEQGGRSPERTRTVAIVAVVVVIGFVSFGLGFFGGSRDAPATVIINGSSSQWPDRPVDAEDSPIGHPVQLDLGGTYAFMAEQKDRSGPVTYDPCVPVHLVVNDRTAIDDADLLVGDAIEEIESATGLELIIDGPTDEAPSKERPAQIDRYGDGWAPVLLSWSDERESPRLQGPTAGIGGSRSAARDGHLWFVSGGVTLDGPQLANLIDTPGGWKDARAVVMHELAHVIGLDHVDAAGEIMRPSGTPDLTTWGPGDLTGLAALGSGRCVDY